MNAVDTSDLSKIAVIAAGLVLFTYMIWLSRSKKKNLADKRRRLKEKWKRRLDHE